MNLSKVIEIFTLYGADTAVLAAACALIVQICKLTFLKNVPKKFVTFAPFVVGVILYAVYAAAVHLSFTYVFAQFGEVLEKGLQTGTVATLLYVLYEQFVRDCEDGGDGGSGDGGAADGGVTADDETDGEVETAAEII